MFRGIPPFVIPIGDAPNVDRIPVVTWTLMALQALALFFVAWPQYRTDAPLDRAGYVEWAEATGAESEALPGLEPTADISEDDILSMKLMFDRPDSYTVFLFGEGYRSAEPSFSKLFRSLFIHAGLLAAALHLLLLWIFGDNVEHHIGWVAFTLLYVVGGVVGAFLAAHVNPMDSPRPVLASTSALGAVVGAYFIFFKRNEVEVAYVFGKPWGLHSVLAERRFFKARVVIVGCLFVVGLASNSGFGARGATLVGFALGIMTALTLRKLFGPDDSVAPHPWYPEALSMRVPLTERITIFLKGGREGDAVQLYLETRHQTGSELDAASLKQIVDWLERHGSPALAQAARRDLDSASGGTSSAPSTQ